MYIEKNSKGVTKTKLVDYWMNKNINCNIKINNTNIIIKKSEHLNKIEKPKK